MKKLMIAAAAVAMVGGAFANNVYDFTATLKTTVGKAGKDATYTRNLGKSGSTFWYQDGGTTWNDDGTIDYPGTYEIWIIAQAGAFTAKKINGNWVPALTTDAKGYLTTTNDVMYLEQVREAVVELAAEYNEKSAGKWCETVKILYPAQCYRVAGTKKIKAYVYQPDCCQEHSWYGDNDVLCFRGWNASKVTSSLNGNNRFYYYDVDTEICYSKTRAQTYTLDDDNGIITNDVDNIAFMQVFGAQTIEKAKKVEILAPVSSLTTDGIEFWGMLAGQGARSTYDDTTIFTSISGNIVGKLQPPTCENCCTDPTGAIAFDCYDGSYLGKPFYDTAAFGSFRIKFNKSMTVKLNNY